LRIHNLLTKYQQKNKADRKHFFINFYNVNTCFTGILNKFSFIAHIFFSYLFDNIIDP
jgi:hypothetical protein